MRVKVGKDTRAALGDIIVIDAALRPVAQTGRLFVFARSREDDGFSPYVPDVKQKLEIAGNGPPPMLQPLTFRLTSQRPRRTLKIVSDIDGWFCVMQEIDTPAEAKVRVSMSRQVDPRLPWPQRVVRQVSGLWA